ncbi:MAG: hypothetical protein JXA28_07300 [Bacteroidetes bacterium]|nr:hypothetical protein [Bacteroidota bacterium]
MQDATVSLVELSALISFGVLILALLLTFWRLFRGRDLADRVVALDLIAIILIGGIAGYTVMTDVAVLLNSASVLALIVFLGTVAFARYLERSVK